jgi:hypothetical protein
MGGIMKKSFLLILIVLALSGTVMISVSSAETENTVINALTPLNDVEFSACTYYNPPVFQWETDGVFKKIEIQFSKENSFTAPIKLKGNPGINQIVSKTSSWKKIFLLPGTEGGTVYWKVIGTKQDKSTIESNVLSFIIKESAPAGNPSIDLSSSPPGLSWGNNCNVSFKIWLSGADNSAKKKGFSFKVTDPEADGGISDRQLTASQWKAINGLVTNSASSITWYIESWDKMKRYSKTQEMSFILAGDTQPLKLELYDVGFFSIQKPKDWEVTISGACSTLAFVIRDPNQPLREIFYFGSVGPVYLNDTQKQLDQNYVNQGGYSFITWLDAPVVNPLTVENYFTHWPDIAEMQAAKDFMGDAFPRLEKLTVVSSLPQPGIGIPGAATALLRGVFEEGNEIGEGQFFGSVWVFMPYMGTPGAGTAYGSFILGATAPKTEFGTLLPKLVESLESFTVTQSYVDWCLIQSQQMWGAVAEAGKTLSEASDIIYDGWQNRTQTDDIMAEKGSDAILGVERVYDPGTGNVYEFDVGWYEDYALDPSKYNLGDLQLLPDNCYECWMTPPLYGPTYIHPD